MPSTASTVIQLYPTVSATLSSVLSDSIVRLVCHYDKRYPLYERMADIAIATMRAMAADHDRRVKNGPRCVKLLTRGIYYKLEYFNLLRKIAAESSDKKAAETCRKRCQWLVDNGIFLHGYADKEHWDTVPDSASPTGRCSLAFHLKPGSSPSHALKSILEGFALFDCSLTCQVAYYKAIEDALGPKKFDELFGTDSPLPLRLSYDTAIPIHFLTRQINAASIDAFRRGHIIYVAGYKGYVYKHLASHGRGMNVLWSQSFSDEQCVGFGLNPVGALLTDAQKLLVDDYNSAPIRGERFRADVARKLLLSYAGGLFQGQIEKVKKIISENLAAIVKHDNAYIAVAYIELAKKENHTITMKELVADSEDICKGITELDESRISQLVKSSLAEGKELLRTWCADASKIDDTHKRESENFAKIAAAFENIGNLQMELFRKLYNSTQGH